MKRVYPRSSTMIEAIELTKRFDHFTAIDRLSLHVAEGEVLAQMKPASYDRALVAAHGAEWMERWDREVRGHGATP